MKYSILTFLCLCTIHGSCQSIAKNNINSFEDLSSYINNYCQYATNVVSKEITFDFQKIKYSEGLWAISSINKNSHFVFLSRDSLFVIKMNRPLNAIIDEFNFISQKNQFFNNDTIYNNCLNEIIRIHKYNYYFDNGNQRIAIPNYDPNFWCIDSVKNINVHIDENTYFEEINGSNN